MLRFEGDRDFPQPPAELFARLGDARFLVGCIPDVEAVREADAGRAELVLRPGFAFVRGTLDVTLRITEKSEPSAVRVALDSRGIGSTSEVEASLALAPADGGTRVHWVAEVKSLGGLLKMVPSGLIRGAAQKVINDAWDRVAAALGPGQADKQAGP
jgi:carbon monoxide dehydrogenase subunit G